MGLFICPGCLVYSRVWALHCWCLKKVTLCDIRDQDATKHNMWGRIVITGKGRSSRCVDLRGNHKPLLAGKKVAI